MAKDGFSMSNRAQTPEIIEDAKTLTVDDCGKLLVLDSAGGLVLTLPSCASALAGWNCDILIRTAATTGNTYKISTAGSGSGVDGAGTDIYIGGVEIVADVKAQLTANSQAFAANGTSNDHMNLTFKTRGGQAGGSVRLVTDGNLWYVTGQLIGSGTFVTPFADA